LATAQKIADGLCLQNKLTTVDPIQNGENKVFKCHICQRVSEPGEIPVMVIVEKREKVYPPRRSAKVVHKDNHTYAVDDDGGIGWEIVKEVLTHKECPVPRPVEVKKR
jgi:hypothetical protein